MASLMGFLFFIVAWLCSSQGESQTVVYSFCIIANVWWAAAYIARERP